MKRSNPPWTNLALVAPLTLAASLAHGGGIGYAPGTSWTATRGMTQTYSAESMGLGRLSFSLHSSYYAQDNAYAWTPPQGAGIATGQGAVALGIGPYADAFGAAAVYSVSGWPKGPASGIGSLLGGLQLALPLPEEIPFRLALHGMAIAGTARDQINDGTKEHQAEGYNFFETRTASDLVLRVLQTFLLGTESVPVRLHFNEGVATPVDQKGKASHLLLAAGIEVDPTPYLALGLEANSRTKIPQFSFGHDPLWVTPSLTLRTPYGLGFRLGSDVRLSKERTSPSTQSLEKWRAFGGMDFSIDILAPRRREARMRFVRDSMERIDLQSKVASLEKRVDDLRGRVESDSVELARRDAELAKRTAEHAQTKNLTAAARAKADSLAIRLREDSLALVSAKAMLDRERKRGNDIERQFLETGVLSLEAVYFENGKSVLSMNSKPYLGLIGKILVKYPKLQLEVAGHTDNRGNPVKNRTLSQARAEAVQSYFVESFPELAGNVVARGYGAERPKADNKKEAGRKANRRVEIGVLNRDALKEYAAQ